MKTLSLCAQLDIEAAADAPAKSARVRIVAYTGDVMHSAAYGEHVVDLSGVTADAPLPIIAGHETADPAAQLGVGKFVNRDGKLIVTGELHGATTGSRDVIDALHAKVPLQASIGATVQEVEAAPPGARVSVNGRTFTAGPHGLAIIRKCHIREVSVVATGASRNTSVALAAALSLSSLKEPQDMATIQELEAALPGADEKFLVSQLKAGATVAAAQAAFIAEQARELTRLRAAAATRPTKPAVEPLTTPLRANREAPSGASGFLGEIRARMQAGLSRAAAVSELAREYPDLHAEFLEETNAGNRGAARARLLRG